MRKVQIINIISFIIILLFVYTSTSKLLLYQNFKAVLSQTTELRPFAPILAIAIPATELAISILLFLPKTRLIGLRFSLGLMLIFTVYVSYISFLSHHAPCACGGIFRGLSWKQHVILNSFFSIISAAGLWLKKNDHKEIAIA